jgi:hypothetical protein
VDFGLWIVDFGFLQNIDYQLFVKIRNPQSAIRNPQSAIRNPQSAIHNPQSAIHNPQSEIPLLVVKFDN